MYISLLGTGLMGFPMAERILKAGHVLYVYNRTSSKAQPLKEQGAKLALNPQRAIVPSECIILMLSDVKAIKEVLFHNGHRDFLNKTVIQMGTIAPAESIELQKKIFDGKGDYLECPVLGSKREAREGKLILMVGASKDNFLKWQNFLEIFGPNPRHIGEVGKASALKLALNHLIAAHATAFSLSLGLIQRSGVRTDDFMEILKGSFLFAPMFVRKLPNWLNHQYDDPNFPLKHLFKDMELILKESQNRGLETKIVESMLAVLRKALEKELGDKDYSSVFEIVNAPLCSG